MENEIDYKQLAKDFAFALTACATYSASTNVCKCICCSSVYVDGYIVHEEFCIVKKAVEFIQGLYNEKI